MNNNLTYFLLGCILFTAFWQLEIIYIVASNPLSWGYNFGGLGDLGLQLYSWRDFWYAIIFIVFIAVILLQIKSRKVK